MMKHYLFLLAGLCSVRVSAQSFPELDTNFNTSVVLVPSPVQITPLFIGSQSQVKKPASMGGTYAPAKQNHDFTALVTFNDSSDFQIVVNHELRGADNALDDGGGMTSFRVKRTNGSWDVEGDFEYVDFYSTVGGTYVNCGGGQTPNGKIATAEEFPPLNNSELSANGYRDTSDYVIPAGNAFEGKTLKRYQNFGWMVEVDPLTKKATQKYYKMGRFSHEGGLFMPDGKTVYLTDDNTPGVFFKYVASQIGNYTDGQLYAYKQNSGQSSGSWMALPMAWDSLLDIRNVALRMGATMFNRLEWVVRAENGKVFMTETGRDKVTQFKPYMLAGTNMPARHLMVNSTLNQGDSTFVDFYGRVLVFDPQNNEISVFIEGGTSPSNTARNLSNPDGLATVRIDGRDFLLIHEDLNGSSMNRDPQGNNNCEAYFADASQNSVQIDDLYRFMIGPNGSELTGGVFSPDGKTLFINIQHPNNTNTPPYNNSTTVAVTNYDVFLKSLSVDESTRTAKQFLVFPNPATREISFNQRGDIAIYNLNGEKVRVYRDATKADVSALIPGIYFVQNMKGEVARLIIQ